jgi:hypothetical protein
MVKRKTIPKKVREAVYAKYGGHCAYCGKRYADSLAYVKNIKNVHFIR